MAENTNYKLVLWQGEDVIAETIFDALQYSPAVRLSVDVRGLVKGFISNLQKTLSSKNLQTCISVGNDKTYDLEGYFKEQVKRYPLDIQKEFNKIPEVTSQTFDGITISGVECKLGLYINENPVIERVFYVYNYNPAVRYSLDAVHTLDYIKYLIMEHLRKEDLNYMIDNSILLSNYKMTINDIYILPKRERCQLLQKVRVTNR